MSTSRENRSYLVESSLFTREDLRQQRMAPAPEKPAERPAAAEQPKPRPVARGSCNPIVGPDQTVVSQAFPTGEMASSALAVHTVMPKEVHVNQAYEYQLQVCNLTDIELQNVVVTNESTNNLEVISSDPPASRGADGSAQWVLGALAPHDMEIITVTGKAGSTGISSNCIAVAYNNFLCAETKVVEPALTLKKTATPEVLLCDTIQINYVVTNSGTGDCENVVVNDRLPEGLTTADGQTTVSFNAGTLAPGQSKDFRVNAKAARTGRFSSPASATSDCNAEATAEPVTTIVRQPKLAIEAVCRERLFLGRDATFTFNVTNSGDAACDETVISAPLPAGTTLVSADNGGQLTGNTVVWNVGTISASGGKRSVNMIVKPNNIGTLNASATAVCTCAAQVSDACETAVEGIPALLLEVIDLEDPDEVGTSETYVISVTNQGSAVATNIKVTARLPEEMEFVSSGGATQATHANRTVTFSPLPSLPPKAKAEFRVTVRGIAPGDVRFAVSMIADQLTSTVDETESTNLYR